MKTLLMAPLALCFCLPAQADFSYTQTRKATGGMMAGLAAGNGPQTSKISLKGQRMKTDDGITSIIMDFDAQTITTISKAQKTYTLKNFTDMIADSNDVHAKADLKETGQTKTINGYSATEAIMTMEMDAPQVGKAQVEIDMWISREVPGAQDLRAFFLKNADKFPWGALAGGGNRGMASAMTELQKKMATLNGVPVQQIIRIQAPVSFSAAGGAQAGQMQNAMEQMRKQLESMASQGGPAAAIAKQQLARMGPAIPAGGTPGAGNSLLEMTLDSSDFSSAIIPDDAFAIPAGYQKN